LGRNCLLQRVTEGKIQGKIEVTGRQGRIRRKLLDDLKERRGYSHLKEEALDRTMWKACCGRGFGTVVRQTAKWMDEVCGQKPYNLEPYRDVLQPLLHSRKLFFYALQCFRPAIIFCILTFTYLTHTHFKYWCIFFSVRYTLCGTSV
jgi:hypothetical protein